MLQNSKTSKQRLDLGKKITDVSRELNWHLSNTRWVFLLWQVFSGDVRVSSFYTASSWGLMFDVYSVFLLRETTDSVFIILKFSEVGDK